MIIFSIMTVISITLIIVAVIKSSNIRDEQRHKRQEYFIDKYGDNIINILKQIIDKEHLKFSKCDSLLKLEIEVVEYIIQKIETMNNDTEFYNYINEFKKFGELENIISSIIYRNYVTILELYKKVQVSK